MRRRVTAAALAACAASLLAGCTGGPSTPERPALFEREQTEQDAFPLSLPDTYDEESIRYAGEDSAGDRYWVGTSGTEACILWHAASGADWMGTCGGLPLTGGAQGVRFEFADAPSQLDPQSAELVGDTVLVQRS